MQQRLYCFLISISICIAPCTLSMPGSNTSMRAEAYGLYKNARRLIFQDRPREAIPLYRQILKMPLEDSDLLKVTVRTALASLEQEHCEHEDKRMRFND